jgi:hypothetical protein
MKWLIVVAQRASIHAAKASHRLNCSGDRRHLVIIDEYDTILLALFDLRLPVCADAVAAIDRSTMKIAVAAGGNNAAFDIY